MYLGVRVVIAKTIERIHKANLINFCIVPVELADPTVYDKIKQGDSLQIENLTDAIKNSDKVQIKDQTGSFEFTGKLNISQRDREILLCAGLLNYTKSRN